MSSSSSKCCFTSGPAGSQDLSRSVLCSKKLFTRTFCGEVTNSIIVNTRILRTERLIVTAADTIFENLTVENELTVNGPINGCGLQCGDLLVGNGTTMTCLPVGPIDSILTSTGVGTCAEWRDSITVNNITINGTISACAGSNTGTILTGDGAGDMLCFDPLVDNPIPAAPGDVLTYTGIGPFGAEWLGLSTASVCTDNFGLTIGRGALAAIGCVVPNLLPGPPPPPGQILAYDGFVGQQGIGPMPGAGVQWAATNSAASRSQVLFFDSTLGTAGLPTYNAASAVPAALLLPATGAPIPTWVSPTNPGECICFDGGDIIFNLLNVTWRLDNTTIGTVRDLNVGSILGIVEGLLWDAAVAVDQFPAGDITVALNPGPGMFLPVNALAPSYTEVTITRTGTYSFFANLTFDRGMGSNATVAVLQFVQSALPLAPITFGPAILTNAIPASGTPGTIVIQQIITVTSVPALFAVQTETGDTGGALINFPSINPSTTVPDSSWNIIRLA